MIVDKEKLEKLRGIIPCTSSVEFVPTCFKAVSESEELKEYTPLFKCRQIRNGEIDAFKMYARKSVEPDLFEGKKAEAINLLTGIIESWSNLYNLSTAELFPFSIENIYLLPETVLDSVIIDMIRYAGFRG